MDILEILYTREFKKVTYNVRKLSITSKNLLLLGPRGSGKTTMIYDYLSQKKRGSFLYIDFDDFRLIDKNIQDDLPQFLKKHHISLLVMENFDFSFEIPSCAEMIISTNSQHVLEGFESVVLYPLDFEEFISFDKRELNIEAIFATYAAYGTFPAIHFQNKMDFVKTYQDFIKRFCENELQKRVLKLLSLYQGKVVSIYALFCETKQNIKISKDTFYSYTKKLQDEYVLFLVEKFGSKKSPKKLYLIDFALRSALSFEKDFIKRFENIVFLELMKRQKRFYYTDVIDFYLPDEDRAIITIPFLPSNLIESKLQRLSMHFKELDIKIVQVITMEVESSYEKEGISYEMLPFYNFATLL